MSKSSQVIGVCIECQKEKTIYLKNMCKTCYERVRRHRKNNISSCSTCKQRRVCLPDGQCKKCFEGKTKLVECVKCHELLPSFARGMCKNCYNVDYSSNKKQEICSGCQKLKKIHRRTEEGKWCAACNASMQKSECCECGEIGRSYKIIEEGNLCWRCYSQRRETDTCSRCNKTKVMAVSKTKMCYDCYNKEYYQDPINIARRALHTYNRRKHCSVGSFSAQDWLDIMEEFDWTCFYCEKKLTSKTRTMDHIIPISCGGPNESWNIVPCCSSCNSKKNNKDVREWGSDTILSKLTRHRKLALEAING